MGLFSGIGGLLGPIGGIAGSIFGGPIGGIVGGMAGSALGGSLSGGVGGGAGSNGPGQTPYIAQAGLPGVGAMNPFLGQAAPIPIPGAAPQSTYQAQLAPLNMLDYSKAIQSGQDAFNAGQGVVGKNASALGSLAGQNVVAPNTGAMGQIAGQLQGVGGANVTGGTIGQFQGLANALRSQMAGNGPSLAQLQLQSALQQNAGAAASAINSVRGINGSQAARGITQQMSGLNANAALQSAMIRNQEQMQAQGLLGSTLGAMGGMQLGQQQNNMSGLSAAGALQGQAGQLNLGQQTAQGQMLANAGQLGLGQMGAGTGMLSAGAGANNAQNAAQVANYGMMQNINANTALQNASLGLQGMGLQERAYEANQNNYFGTQQMNANIYGQNANLAGQAQGINSGIALQNAQAGGKQFGGLMGGLSGLGGLGGLGGGGGGPNVYGGFPGSDFDGAVTGGGMAGGGEVGYAGGGMPQQAQPQDQAAMQAAMQPVAPPQPAYPSSFMKMLMARALPQHLDDGGEVGGGAFDAASLSAEDMSGMAHGGEVPGYDLGGAIGSFLGKVGGGLEHLGSWALHNPLAIMNPSIGLGAATLGVQLPGMQKGLGMGIPGLLNGGAGGGGKMPDPNNPPSTATAGSAMMAPPPGLYGAGNPYQQNLGPNVTGGGGQMPPLGTLAPSPQQGAHAIGGGMLPGLAGMFHPGSGASYGGGGLQGFLGSLGGMMGGGGPVPGTTPPTMGGGFAGAGHPLALMSGGGEADARGGGPVPGKAKVRGDSPQNDTVSVKVSPGDGVIPRSIMQSPNAPALAAQFVAAIKAREAAGQGGRAPQGFGAALASHRALAGRSARAKHLWGGGMVKGGFRSGSLPFGPFPSGMESIPSMSVTADELHAMLSGGYSGSKKAVRAYVGPDADDDESDDNDDED